MSNASRSIGMTDPPTDCRQRILVSTNWTCRRTRLTTSCAPCCSRPSRSVPKVSALPEEIERTIGEACVSKPLFLLPPAPPPSPPLFVMCTDGNATEPQTLLYQPLLISSLSRESKKNNKNDDYRHACTTQLLFATAGVPTTAYYQPCQAFFFFLCLGLNFSFPPLCSLLYSIRAPSIAL